MLGPGLAILPPEESKLTVYAPAAGLVRTIHPHAFVLQVSPKLAVLVHLGIDTFRAEGELFEPLVEQGRYVTHMQPIIEWDVPATVAAGFVTWVPVTILGFKKGEMELEKLLPQNTTVRAGQELLQLTLGFTQSN